MADWALKLQRLLFDRSLRPAKRSTALISMANSMGTIASALKIIAQREYGVDLDHVAVSRADLEREVFEPMYPDNEAEAVREEVERIRALEAESAAGDGSQGLKSHPNASDTQIPRFGMKFARTDRSGSDSDGLTEQERDFMAEIDSEGDRST